MYTASYTPRDRDKFEGKIRAVVQSLIDNGIDVKIIISELVTTTYYDSVIGREKNRYFSYHTIDFKINDDNRYPGSSKIVRS